MSGYLILAMIMLLALAGMWLMQVRSGMLLMGAAALMIGAAGYAWQGSPALEGSPRADKQAEAPIPLDRARELFLGRFNASDRFFLLAEARARRGNTQDAVGAMRAAVKQYPDYYGVWVGLGNALADHARGITPASRYAFARAKMLAPDAPAPDYFLGLALLRSGEPEEALALWKPLLDDAPENAPWRPMVAEGVALIEGTMPRDQAGS